MYSKKAPEFEALGVGAKKTDQVALPSVSLPLECVLIFGRTVTESNNTWDGSEIIITSLPFV